MGKSKFVTFILSALPGLGHIYLGLLNRGLVFMAAFLGWIALVLLGEAIIGASHFPALLVLLPIIGLYGLVDALHLCGRMQAGETVPDVSPLAEFGKSLAKGYKSKLAALFLSIIPGAGHMYLGWQQRGLGLMAVFFLNLFLMDWVHLSLFLFVLPLIWFYSFFDVLKLVSSGTGTAPEAEGALFSWLAERQRWAGIGLIALGALILFERLVVPYLSYQIVNMIKTGFVAALLIGGGLRLAWGSKIAVQNRNMEGVECRDKEEPCGSGE